MNCTDLEILLCDYVDGTLTGDQKSAVEQHLAVCPACADLARDSASAIAFMERAADVEPPAAMITRILFEIPAARRAAHSDSGSFWKRFRAKWLEPVLQPRFAMGMAMTILSFAMLGRFAGIQVRPLKPSDLDPVKVWMAVEDQAARSWERALKYYDTLKVVYDIQSRLKEWGDQAEADGAKKIPASETGQPGPDQSKKQEAAADPGDQQKGVLK